MEKSKNNSGFTLIEVLVVVSIIGLLSAVTLIGLGSFRAAGRDSRRMADLRQYQNGLELYYAKNGKYPDGSSLGALPNLVAAGIGVQSIPHDPVNIASKDYQYKTCGSGYLLVAYLDDANNNKGGAPSGTCSENTCGGTVFCLSF